MAQVEGYPLHEGLGKIARAHKGTEDDASLIATFYRTLERECPDMNEYWKGSVTQQYAIFVFNGVRDSRLRNYKLQDAKKGGA